MQLTIDCIHICDISPFFRPFQERCDEISFESATTDRFESNIRYVLLLHDITTKSDRVVVQGYTHRISQELLRLSDIWVAPPLMACTTKYTRDNIWTVYDVKCDCLTYMHTCRSLPRICWSLAAASLGPCRDIKLLRMRGLETTHHTR